MKTKQTKLLSMTAILLGCLLTACSNDEEGKGFTDESVAIQPAKTPDFLVYSGSNIIGSTFGTRVDATVNGNYFKIQDFGGGKSDWMHDNFPVLYNSFDNAPTTTDRGEQVSNEEYNIVMQYLKDHPNEGDTTCDLTTYFIQNVGSSYDTYTVEFKNGESVHHTATITGGNQMDYLQFGDIHLNDYNAHNGPRALCVGIPVVNPSYHDSWGTEEQTKTNAYRFYYIDVNGKTGLYLCFDYQVKKYDNGQLDFKGDGVFSDWVIKLTPADGSDVTAPGSGSGSGSGETPIVDPADNTNMKGEIEVNLSVNDKKDEGDYIATKLSIHVRDTADVEVIIPVSAEYYCEADDMDIVLSHRLTDEQWADSYQTMTYQVDGHDVTLTVSYTADYIKVATQGITADVLKYLRTNYYDGITFEVWNYYKDNITRAQLKTMLDATTITFTADPGRYVNAFARLNDEQNPWDCKVTPPAAYSEVQKNEGTPNYNVIYKK